MPLGFKPTGTTNYMLSEFNTKNLDRNLFGEGGVPLHKIVYMLYDFLYNYINLGSDSKIYYFHAICKANGDNRPPCPILFKIPGQKTKKTRIQELDKFIADLLNNMDHIFDNFIKNGRIKSSYRTDVKPQQLLTAFNDWNCIKEKLINLTK